MVTQIYNTGRKGETKKMVTQVSKITLMLALVVALAIPAGAIDFENPPYTEAAIAPVGGAPGQDGWIQEETEDIPDISSYNPLAGNQSVLFYRAEGAGPDIQRAWRGTTDVTFYSATLVSYLVQVEQGSVSYYMGDDTGAGYIRFTADVDQNIFRIGGGWEGVTPYLSIEDCRAGNLYQVNTVLDFVTQRQRTTVQNLTEVQDLIDSGVLDLNASTTLATVSTQPVHDVKYAGIKFTGGRYGQDGSMGRFDSLTFT